MVQAFYTQLNTLLNEYKVKFDVVDLKNLYLSVPVKQPDEIRSFAESLLRLGYPSALWIHITPCVNCGGARAEIFFYNLSVSRLLLVKNEEMAMNASVISQKEPLKEIVKTALSPFNVEFEEAISSGRLFSYVYHLEVEELRSLEHLKRVEERITSLDLNRQPVLKSASKEGAEYEIKSLLGYDELERQLAQIPMDGAKVKIR